MTAQDKFEARLKELGLMEEWKKQGSCGRVAIETEDEIILLVNEGPDDDRYTEEHFPTFEELRTNPEFVKECKNEWYTEMDADFVQKLAIWLEFGKKAGDCPLFPVDVYFPGNSMMTSWKDFEDDIEIDIEEEEEQYQSSIDKNSGKLQIIETQLAFFKSELVDMIRQELGRGHNIPEDFDPYPGWGSPYLCGYNIECHVASIRIDESDALVLHFEGCDSFDIYIGGSDFPIAVLMHIYECMK